MIEHRFQLFKFELERIHSTTYLLGKQMNYYKTLH